MPRRFGAMFVLVTALAMAGCGPAHQVTTHPVAAHASVTASPPGPTTASPPGPTTGSPPGSSTASPPGRSPVKPTRQAKPAPTTKKPSPAAPGGSGPFGTKKTTGNRSVALTFDDGPNPDWTPKVLDLLRDSGVKATFCLVGFRAQQYPQLVARIVREGHTLCNHSWKHDFDLGKKSDAAIRADLLQTNEAIRRAVPGARIPYFRQPGGMWTAQVVKTARSLGFVPLHWDVDPWDWAKPGATVITQRVESHVRQGSIVLMHDGGGDRSGTLAACQVLVPWLKQRFKLVKLP